MIYVKRAALFFLFWLSALIGFSQQLNGHWFGIGVMPDVKAYNSYMLELILRQKGNTIWGEFDYYFKDSLIKTKISGNYDDKKRKLLIKPFPVVYYLSPNARNSIDVMLSGEFGLVVSKTESSLNGFLFPDDDHKYTVPRINYRLTRSNDTMDAVMRVEEEVEAKTIAKKPVTDSAGVIPVDTTLKNADTAFLQRARVYTRELEVENTELRIEIYDNGEIDRDSISLFFNNKRVLPKTMLTHKAIRLTLKFDNSIPENELVMFAENLGFIPPNTAALILYDGKKRYEINLTSDLSKSATLRLKKKTAVQR